MDLFLSFFTSVIISIVLIPLLMRSAVYLHMIDEPGERKVHSCAIPRCGGLGLAIGAVVAVLLFIPSNSEIISLMLGSVVILFFGLLDDRFELHYKWKFAGQLLATFIVIYGGISISYIPFGSLEPASPYFTLPLTVLFAIGVTNAVNLSDGLDGLAAGIMLMTLAAIAFLALVVSGQEVALIALAVAGGIVGFLWFNTHPAMVFMGDTGSQFIGFMAAFLTIYLTQNVYQTLNPALPLLLLGMPILDTISVMVRRIHDGKSPFSADKTHIHHRLLEYGFSHAQAVGSIYFLQGIYLLAAFNLRYASDVLVLTVYMLISGLILLLFYVAGKSGWSLRHAEQKQQRRGFSIWRSQRLYQFTRIYIETGLAFFLWIMIASFARKIPELPENIVFLLLVGFGAFILLPRTLQDIFVRVSVYISAVFSSIIAASFPDLKIVTHWGFDVFLLVLIVMVSMAVRMTRKSRFRMTTQDILVVMFVIAALLLVNVELVTHVIFRLFCLAYALEYLLNREVYLMRLVRYSAITSGLLVVSVVLSSQI